MAQEMRQSGLGLAVTVQPRVRESASPGPGAMGWAELCAHADRLQVMLYNLHNARTPPGPMATPRWAEEVLRHGADHCPAERIVPVLKVSGMDWADGSARALHFEDAERLQVRHGARRERDGAGSVPWFHYTTGGVRHTVYFEDARSLERKIDAVAALGPRRVIFWSLGRHDPGLFPLLVRRWGGAPGPGER
jgi:spore germination protein YaaH